VAAGAGKCLTSEHQNLAAMPRSPGQREEGQSMSSCCVPWLPAPRRAMPSVPQTPSPCQELPAPSHPVQPHLTRQLLPRLSPTVPHRLTSHPRTHADCAPSPTLTTLLAQPWPPLPPSPPCREPDPCQRLCPCSPGSSLPLRIIEPLRLEKTSKIIKSNCQPNTTMPAKPCPEVPHLHLQGW